MNREKNLSKKLPALILLLFLSACSYLAATPAVHTLVVTQEVRRPVVQEVTQEVTRLVTQDVTREVTRIVEAPVTVTPEPTAGTTSTPDPNAPPVSASRPQGTLQKHTDCNYGPADWFTYKTSFPEGTQVEVVGKDESGKWLAIQEVGGWNYCWVSADVAQLTGIDMGSLPVAQVLFPRSKYEFGSPLTATTRRTGNEVTVSWEAVFMSLDEVHGYVLDLEVCRSNQIQHSYIFVPVTYEENQGILSAVFDDEAGCSEPSKAYIITYGRRGFAEWEMIFWPPHP
jgi:hypothetical protein